MKITKKLGKKQHFIKKKKGAMKMEMIKMMKEMGAKVLIDFI